MNIQDGIGHAVTLIEDSLDENLLPQKVEYYQSGRIMNGEIISFDISKKFPKLRVKSQTGKEYGLPFFNVIKIHGKI